MPTRRPETVLPRRRPIPILPLAGCSSLQVDLRSEVVYLPGLSLEIRRRTHLGESLETRLPIRAQAMIAWIHWKEKIRLAAVCPNPGAIEPYARRRAPHRAAGIENINQRSTRFWLCAGVPILIGLYIELDLVRATPSRRKGCRPVLCKDRRCEEKDCQHSFHHKHLR